MSNVRAINDNSEDDALVNKSTTDKPISKPKSILIDWVLAALSPLFYSITLKGCEETLTSCLVHTDLNILYLLVFLVLLSSLFVSILLKRYFNHKRPYPLVLCGFTLLFLFYKDRGSDLRQHGYYNQLGFFLFSFIQVCFYLLAKLSLLLTNKLKYLFICIALAILCFFGFQTYILYFNTCQDFKLGLFGKTEPFNKKCNFVSPSKCWLDLLDDTLDMSRLFNINCSTSNSESSFQEWKKHLPFDLAENDSFCFPPTNQFDYRKEGLQENIQSTIFSQIKRESDFCEVKLEFKDKIGSVTVNLQKNEALSKERKQIKSKSKVKNILFLYIDALSRRHFHRKMKKTAAFFEKVAKTNKVVEFFKHQAFIYFTEQNVMPMFFGESMFKKSGVSLFKHLKSQGYITGATQEQCSSLLYDLEEGYIDDVEFEHPDHENIALTCDPNAHSTEHPFSPYTGPYSQVKRCLYGKQIHDYSLEYAKQFWRAYKDNKKFLRVASITAHEGSGEVVKYYDESLASFLEELENDNLLEDTAIMLYSDHGNNMFGLYYVLNFEDFYLEKTMSSGFMVLPRKHNLSEEETRKLETNAGKMTCHYDVFNTILNFAGDDQNTSERGFTLTEEVPDRDCSDFSLDMKAEWCRCKN